MIKETHKYLNLLVIVLVAVVLHGCSKDDNNTNNEKDQEEQAATSGDFFMKFKLNGNEVEYSDFTSATINAKNMEDGSYSLLLIGIHQNAPSIASSNISIGLSSIFDNSNEKFKEGTYTNPGIYETYLDDDGLPIHPYPFMLITLSTPSSPTVAHLALSATVTLSSITDNEVSGTFSAEFSTGSDIHTVTDIITDGRFKLEREN